MLAPASLTPAARFALIIDGLCQILAAHGLRRRVAGPLLVLLWSWLRRTIARFHRLATRQREGRTRPARPRPTAPGSRPRHARAPNRPRLPQGFAWLVRLVPEAASCGSQLQHLLAEPEMTALLAAAPTAGRLIRPLCRMLGVRPPPGLGQPARTPAPSLRPAASAPTNPPSPPARPAAEQPAQPPTPLDPPRAASPRGPGPPVPR